MTKIKFEKFLHFFRKIKYNFFAESPKYYGNLLVYIYIFEKNLEIKELSVFSFLVLIFGRIKEPMGFMK